MDLEQLAKLLFFTTTPAGAALAASYPVMATGEKAYNELYRLPRDIEASIEAKTGTPFKFGGRGQPEVELVRDESLGPPPPPEAIRAYLAGSSSPPPPESSPPPPPPPSAGSDSAMSRFLLEMLKGSGPSDNLVMPRDTMEMVRQKASRIAERPAPVFDTMGSGGVAAPAPPPLPAPRPAFSGGPPAGDPMAPPAVSGAMSSDMPAAGMPAAGAPRSREEILAPVRQRLQQLRGARDVAQGLGTAGTVVTRGDIMFGTQKGQTGRTPMPFLQNLDEEIGVGEQVLAEGRAEDAGKRSFLDELTGEASLMEKKAALDSLVSGGVQLKALSPTEADSLIQMEITYDKLQKVMSLVESEPGAVGPFDYRLGRFMELFGGDVKGANVRRSIESLFAQYVRSISGAQVSAKEFDRLVKAIPTAKDTEEVFMEKARGALQEIAAVQKSTLRAYSRAGRDVSGFAGAELDEGTIQMRTSDGRTFSIPAADEEAFKQQFQGATRL